MAINGLIWLVCGAETPFRACLAAFATKTSTGLDGFTMDQQELTQSFIRT